MQNPTKLYDSVEEFKKNFDQNFKLFQELYEGSILNDFIDDYEDEIKEKFKYYKTAPGLLDLELSKDQETFKEFNILKQKNSLKPCLRFLNEKRVNQPVELTHDKNINTVQWKGTPTELTALIKSLRESKKLDNSLTEKETVKRFQQFFNYNLTGYDQIKSKIRKRMKDLTPFIDKLKDNLENWIQEED